MTFCSMVPVLAQADAQPSFYFLGAAHAAIERRRAAQRARGDPPAGGPAAEGALGPPPADVGPAASLVAYMVSVPSHNSCEAEDAST